MRKGLHPRPANGDMSHHLFYSVLLFFFTPSYLRTIFNIYYSGPYKPCFSLLVIYSPLPSGYASRYFQLRDYHFVFKKKIENIRVKE